MGIDCSVISKCTVQFFPCFFWQSYPFIVGIWQVCKKLVHLLIKNKLKYVFFIICTQIIYVWLIFDPLQKVWVTFIKRNARFCNVYDWRAFILSSLLTVFVSALIGTWECMWLRCWRVFSVFLLQGTIVLCPRFHDIRKKTREVKQRTQRFPMANQVLQNLEDIVG